MLVTVLSASKHTKSTQNTSLDWIHRVDSGLTRGQKKKRKDKARLLWVDPVQSNRFRWNRAPCNLNTRNYNAVLLQLHQPNFIAFHPVFVLLTVLAGASSSSWTSSGWGAARAGRSRCWWGGEKKKQQRTRTQPIEWSMSEWEKESTDG